MKSFQEIGIELTDKISHHRYDRFYPQFLEPLRNKEFNMLEIGYGDGGGLKLWKEYFLQAYINVIDIGVELEDDRSNYWDSASKVYGYEIGHFNFIDLLKQYPDKINKEFTGVNNSLNLSSITFGHNCVIITKSTQEEVELKNRNYRFEKFK